MTHPFRAARGAALFFALLLPLPASAVEWMVGGGLATLSYPAYRGAEQRKLLAVPVPIVSLRSEYWELGRNGAQLDLPGLHNLRIRLSASGSLPVDSDEASARDGMPDLDPSLELGPALTLPLQLGPRLELRPELLTRAVLATDLRSVSAIGWVIQPRLTTTWRPRAPRLEWRLSLGPVYGTRRYHQYFYSVAPRFATPQRAAYEAHSGYGGWRSSTSISWQHGRLGLGTFLSYDGLGGAVFADSPLVLDRGYLIGGLFLSWRLAGSAGWDAL